MIHEPLQGRDARRRSRVAAAGITEVGSVGELAHNEQAARGVCVQGEDAVVLQEHRSLLRDFEGDRFVGVTFDDARFRYLQRVQAEAELGRQDAPHGIVDQRGVDLVVIEGFAQSVAEVVCLRHLDIEAGDGGLDGAARPEEPI